MATLHEEELVGAALDNTSIQKEETSIENSNPIFRLPDDFNEALSCKETHRKDDLHSKGMLTNTQNPSKNDVVDSTNVGAPNDSNLVRETEICAGNSNHSRSLTESFSPVENEGVGGGLVDFEPDDCDEDVMTGSYGEISLDRDILNYDKTSDSLSSREDFCLEENNVSGNGAKEKKRPDSLVLTQNVISSLEELGTSQQIHKCQQTSDGRTTSADISPSFSSEEFAVHSSARTGSDTSGLSELQGTLTVDGGLVTFVAEDLHEKIKMSSPVSRWADGSFPGSRSSTPSLYRQALLPNVHIVDPSILSDLEAQAKKVATSVDTMLENLSGTLQSISSLTVDCMETFESSVCNTCDAVDVNIKAVYQLMAKCEELSNSMNPLHQMSGDVKHIKKMLEQLEYIVEHKS